MVNMKHFRFEHLPPHLQAVSHPVQNLANEMNETLPHCAEKTAGLRKLLEAKDCFVRARLEGDMPDQDAPTGTGTGPEPGPEVPAGGGAPDPA